MTIEDQEPAGLGEFDGAIFNLELP